MDNHTTHITDSAVFKPFAKQRCKGYTHQWTITLHRLLILLYSNHLPNNLLSATLTSGQSHYTYYRYRCNQTILCNNLLRATLTNGQSHYTDYWYCCNQTVYLTTTFYGLDSPMDNHTHRLLILLYSNHLRNNLLRATLTSGQSHYTDYWFCCNQTIYLTTTI